MSNPTEGRDAPDDSFSLGESKVEVRKASTGRRAWRIVVAVVMVALGGFIAFIEHIWPTSKSILLDWIGSEMIKPRIGLGAAIAGIGYAIYDYRWPFGPRPGSRKECKR